MVTLIGANKERYGMIVDDHGRAYVKSNNVSHISHHSTYHKNSYIVPLRTVLAGSSETICGIIKNTSSVKDIELHWLRISSDANLEVKIYADTTRNAGGNEVIMKGMNLTSKSVSVVQAYEGGVSANLTDTANGEVEIDGFFLAANTIANINLEGGMVLGKDNTYCVKVFGANGNIVKVVLASSAHATGSVL